MKFQGLSVIEIESRREIDLFVETGAVWELAYRRDGNSLEKTGGEWVADRLTMPMTSFLIFVIGIYISSMCKKYYT